MRCRSLSGDHDLPVETLLRLARGGAGMSSRGIPMQRHPTDGSELHRALEPNGVDDRPICRTDDGGPKLGRWYGSNLRSSGSQRQRLSLAS